jgi:phospholipid/cholesterol/gamma-HCH transport system permease protein
MPVGIQTAKIAETTQVTLSGDFSLSEVTRLHEVLQNSVVQGAVRVDLAGVTRLDTGAAWALTQAEIAAQEQDHGFAIEQASADVAGLINTVRAGLPKPDTQPPAPLSLHQRIENVGHAVTEAGKFIAQLITYFGLFLARLFSSIIHPSQFRMTSLVHHCQEVGVKAVPIVALMSFLIGVVLAFQGSTQLKQFGAEVFVVDLIAVSILRELGILLTAIIVAGRTASAFTAAIGSMKMREEIDAMRTLGIDPATALFVPRILALLLMLPILGLIANLSGLIGGALMSWAELGISPGMFQTRLVEDTDVSHLLVGMIKAPFFALIIGVVGCQAGMQVGNNAESLGQKTSSAVVTAIFTVIVADAIFSIFFAQVGL